MNIQAEKTLLGPIAKRLTLCVEIIITTFSFSILCNFLNDYVLLLALETIRKLPSFGSEVLKFLHVIIYS